MSDTFYGSEPTAEWEADQRRVDVLMRAAAEEANQVNPLDGLTAQQLEDLAYQSMRTNDQREHDLLSFDAATRWVDAHPEFIQSQRNAHLLLREVARLGLDDTEVDSFEHAFQSLRSDDLVEIDGYQERQLHEDVRAQRRAHRVGALSAKRSAPTDVGGSGEPNYDKLTSAQLQELAMLAAAKGKFF